MVTKEKFTENIINIINELKTKLDKRESVESRTVVDTYNHLFEGVKQKQPYTHCGSCLKRCINDMWNELKAFQTAQESLIEALDEVMDETPTEEVEKAKKRSKKD